MKKRILFALFAAFLLLTRMQAQNTLWDIIYCLNGGENKTVGISKLTSPNPPEKPGWNLIFSDEFNSGTLNNQFWNRSNPWDDGIGTCFRNFSVNPENVTVENQFAKISNTLISMLPDCPFSGGEIKTLSVKDTGFKSYYFYAPGFVEVRVRLFNKTGQGASCWLWGVGTPEDPGGAGPWNEIDLFELNGVNRNIFNATYHWTSLGSHVSQNHSIYLTDSLGLYDLTENWTIFGLEWDSAFIRWYVNNVPVKELDLHRIPPYCLEAPTYSNPSAPFALRLGTSCNTVGNQSQLANPSDFPQSMLVDYVRVYQKSGSKKAPVLISDNQYQICSDTNLTPVSGKIVGTRYYPGYQYQWNSTAFGLIPLEQTMPHPPERYQLRVKEHILPDTDYPLSLTATDNQGITEGDTALIFVHSATPPLPAGSFTPEQTDSTCYYTLVTRVPDHSAGSEFSLDNGSSWSSGTLIRKNDGTICRFGFFKPGTTVQFLFRNINACGASLPQGSTVTFPPPITGCKWPTGSNEEFTSAKKSALILTPNPANQILTVTLPEDYRNIQGRSLEVTDLTGNVISTVRLTGEHTRVDVGRLSRGMYLLRVKTAIGSAIQTKFIRN